jgi:hypothetical protein
VRILLVLAVLTCWCGTAAAQSTSWHGTLNGDVAVTDNVFARPGYSLTNRDGDIIFQLRPGFFVARNAPRMINNFLAEAEIIHYAFNSRYPSVSGRVGWNAFILTGPLSEMIVGVNASTGILTALQSRLTADQTMINVNPPGKVTFQQADASEYFAMTFTREMRMSQNLFARINRNNDNAEDNEPPIPNTIITSAEVGGGFGLDRQFMMSSIGIGAGASVARLERKAPAGAMFGNRLDRTVSPRVNLVYRRDLDRQWSLGADGGIVYVRPFGTDPYNPLEKRHGGWFPVVGAQVAINDVWGRGTLAVRRDVAPNLEIAQQTVNNSATVSAAFPLPWLDDSRRRAPKLVGLTSLGLVRTQLINSQTGETASSIDAARIDAAVSYFPRPNISYTLRYEGQFQRGDSELADSAGFYRNTVYFTFAIRYPDDVAALVPKRRAGQSTRADRKDQSPIGAEPVVPDLVEEGGEGEGDKR